MNKDRRKALTALAEQLEDLKSELETLRYLDTAAE